MYNKKNKKIADMSTKIFNPPPPVLKRQNSKM